MENDSISSSSSESKLPLIVGIVGFALGAAGLVLGLKAKSAADAAQAAALLRQLSGRTHQVHTAVWLVSAGREQSALVSTEVRFSALSEAEIAAYIATGEPFGKAGAYAVQGRAAAVIAGITGSYSGVMGLPLHETAVLLRNFGVPLWSV